MTAKQGKRIVTVETTSARILGGPILSVPIVLIGLHEPWDRYDGHELYPLSETITLRRIEIYDDRYAQLRGSEWRPNGLETSSGNCQWNTSELKLGQAEDPAFVDFNERNPLALDDYALAPESPCLGKGSSVTSVAQLPASSATEKSRLEVASPMTMDRIDDFV